MKGNLPTIAIIAALAAATAGAATPLAPTPRPDRPPQAAPAVGVAMLVPAARFSAPRGAPAAAKPDQAAMIRAVAPTPRPARVAAADPVVAEAAATAALAAVKGAPQPRPAFAPERFEVAPAALSPRNRPGLGVGPGGLCGDARLSGSAVPTVVGAGACGIGNPVRLSAVAGVSLTRPVTVGCGVARRFADWVETSARPAARRLGADLVAIDTFAGYSCRPRNNRPGARLSLHGLGQAVDVGGFRLADGRAVTVKDHWRSAGDKSAFLKTLWRSACGPFGTVLGPGSDGHHEDHFHFDVAKRRTPYCR